MIRGRGEGTLTRCPPPPVPPFPSLRPSSLAAAFWWPTSPLNPAITESCTTRGRRSTTQMQYRPPQRYGWCEHDTCVEGRGSVEGRLGLLGFGWSFFCSLLPLFMCRIAGSPPSPPPRCTAAWPSKALPSSTSASPSLTAHRLR